VTSVTSHRWIDTDDELADLLAELVTVPRYAIDTEFHRERTYFPALALVQLAWETPGGQQLALVDPLKVDVAQFADLFEADVEAVFHAAQQDLDVLTSSVGAVPARLFDTQIAGGFVGYGTPSLVSLLQGELGITVPKGDRLTDWLRRPLSEAQREYAAADVAYLFATQDRLLAELDSLGRVGWVYEACDELRLRPAGMSDPSEAWMRLKDVKGLRPRARAVAQSLAAWRERTAAARNVPVRQVLPDLAILGISQRRPATEGDLKQARGVDERFQRGKVAAEILAAVAEGNAAEPPEPPVSTDDLERDLRPAVTLVSAWVSQVAKQERIDTAMLATRADLIALLAGDPDARLRHGWRAELLGEGIERLVGGQAALTFDKGAGLRLVDLPGG